MKNHNLSLLAEIQVNKNSAYAQYNGNFYTVIDMGEKTITVNFEDNIDRPIKEVQFTRNEVKLVLSIEDTRIEEFENYCLAPFK